MNESTKEERKELNDQNGVVSEIEVYKKNLETSKNKISILEFVLTTTKIDWTFETLEGYLFWGGITEFFTWVILIGLFISDVKDMKMVWFFLYHIPRGAIGMVILSYMPKTYEAIANIHQIESDDLEEIKKQIIEGYVKMVLSKEKVMKPLLIAYFVLTIVSIIVDLLLFCVITPDFGAKNQELRFLILFFAVICFIVQDFIFFIFFNSFKYTFPPEQNGAIRKAIMGFFSQLKVGIAVGFTNVAKIIGRNTSHANGNTNSNDNGNANANAHANCNDNANGNDNENMKNDLCNPFEMSKNDQMNKENVNAEIEINENNNNNHGFNNEELFN